MIRIPLRMSVVVFLWILVVLCLAVRRHRCASKPNFHMFTVVTDITHPNVQKLRRTAQIHGIRLKILHVNVPIRHGFGFGMKLKASRDFLATLPEDDIAMYVDGYDVLIAGRGDDIVARYLDIVNGSRERALFGAEVNCWPDAGLMEKYPRAETRYRYLCSGVYIAHVSTLRALLRDFSDVDEGWETVDDQRFFTHMFFNTDRIVLDTHVRLINNMESGTHSLEYDTRRKAWKNAETSTYPLIFHGNGRSKDFLFRCVYPRLRLPRKKLPSSCQAPGSTTGPSRSF